MQRHLTKIIAVIFVVAGLIAFGLLLHRREQNDKPLIYSDRTVVAALWSSYKERYWEAATGRTIDKQQNNITTSEGQSYTMLRAVWMADKPTFDKTWSWTKKELQHDDDHLFAWKWGKRSNGEYGILLEQGGQNAASDADVDIAFALMMAASRWQEQGYLNEAARIIPRIWSEEVAMINGKPLLMANDLEKGSRATKPITNPSYVAPYAFRVFATIDRKHDWQGLVDSSYDYLNAVTSAKLDNNKNVGLPPNWVLVDRKTGQLSAPTQKDLSTDYGYDAMRTSWRLMLDYQWSKDKRALAILKKPQFLIEQWQKEGTLASIYKLNGNVSLSGEKTAVYAGSIGYFMATDEALAHDFYVRTLQSLFNPNTNQWKHRLSYYDENWAWFGMALYNNSLANITEDY